MFENEVYEVATLATIAPHFILDFTSAILIGVGKVRDRPEVLG
jgi:hypothetical protein